MGFVFFGLGTEREGGADPLELDKPGHGCRRHMNADFRCTKGNVAKMPASPEIPDCPRPLLALTMFVLVLPAESGCAMRRSGVQSVNCASPRLFLLVGSWPDGGWRCGTSRFCFCTSSCLLPFSATHFWASIGAKHSWGLSCLFHYGFRTDFWSALSREFHHPPTFRRIPPRVFAWYWSRGSVHTRALDRFPSWLKIREKGKAENNTG